MERVMEEGSGDGFQPVKEIRKELFVLASEQIDDEDNIMGFRICGVTDEPKVAEAWAAGAGHGAYHCEMDELKVNGYSPMEF